MQRDLFQTSFVPPASSAGKTDLLERYRVSLRADQILAGMIVLLTFYVMVFSFGVEKGKRYAQDEIQAERKKREDIVESLRSHVMDLDVKARAGITEAPVPSPPPPAAEVPEGTPPEAVTAAGTEAVPAPGTSSGKYTIQLVTFTSKTTANRHIRQLSEKGHQGFVIPSGKYLQVCIDAFETRQQAKDLLRKLKGTGLAPKDAFVRTIPH